MSLLVQACELRLTCPSRLHLNLNFGRFFWSSYKGTRIDSVICLSLQFFKSTELIFFCPRAFFLYCRYGKHQICICSGQRHHFAIELERIQLSIVWTTDKCGVDHRYSVEWTYTLCL